uniref:Uncharacterized protein n=1 Tax=Oryza punctata TaxID=4537 RepID=A0A0E0L4B8_ORYPU
MAEAELLTTFQEVAIIDNVTVIKDNASYGAHIYTQIWTRDSRALRKRRGIPPKATPIHHT